MGGGGGGSVSLPTHIEEGHKIWLFGTNEPKYDNHAFPNHLYSLMASALVPGNNPFFGQEYTDPGADLGDIRQKASELYVGYSSNMNSESRFAAIMQAIADRRATDVVEVGATVAASDASARAAAAAVINEAIAKADVVSVDERWEDYVDTVVSRLDTDLLGSLDIDSIAEKALDYARTALQRAREEALAAIDHDTITTLSQLFSDDLDYQRQKALRGLSSQASGLNSVHSSAFIVGRALVEQQFERAMAQNLTQLRTTVYNTLLGGFLELYGAQFAGTGQLQAGVKAARDQVLSQSVALLTQSKASSEQTLAQLKSSISQVFVQAFSAAYGLLAQISGENARLKAIDADAKNRYVLQAGSTAVQHDRTTKELRLAGLHQLTEATRIKTVGVMEYEAAVIDLVYRDHSWDFEVFTYGANVLSAPAGMAALVPKGPSKLQSALGGAATGAGVGSMIPGLGGIGTGLGALAGGVLGYFGG